MRKRQQVPESGGRVEAPAIQGKEQTLVNQCLQGDASAWEVMVQSYRGRIATIVCRYARLRQEVEDLTQDVFLKVHLNLNTFRSDTGAFSPWLSRVGRNLVYDHMRRERQNMQRRALEDSEALNLRDERTTTPEWNIARTEMSCLLRRGLRLLSPDLQEALILRYMEEMSYQEIARKLGVPDGTVKSRICRGCAKLAVHLARLGFSQ